MSKRRPQVSAGSPPSDTPLVSGGPPTQSAAAPSADAPPLEFAGSAQLSGHSEPVDVAASHVAGSTHLTPQANVETESQDAPPGSVDSEAPRAPRDLPRFTEATLLAPVPTEKLHFMKEAKQRKFPRGETAKAKLRLPKELENFRNTLGPEMFEPWLLIVRGRLAGLDVTTIAKHMRLDEELVADIVARPLYLGFEATFRRTMNAAPQLEAAAERMAEVLPETVENLIWWASQKSPATAATSLNAIKTILSACGITTEKKSVERSRTSMAPDQEQKLLAVFGVNTRGGRR